MKSGHKSKKILSKLNQIFCEIFDDNSLKINKNTTAQDIEEWDSLNQIKILPIKLVNILPLPIYVPSVPFFVILLQI